MLEKNKIGSNLEKLLENTGDMALKRRARNIITELDLTDGDNLLDVGCGDGYYTHLVNSLNLKIKQTGTDYSKFDLRRARKNIKDKRVNFVFGDLMKKLPFASNTFNKVIMSEVAEHLPDDVKGLKEVRRVMKKGATICLTVPCQNYPLLWDPLNWFLENFFDTHVKSGFFAGLWNQHIRLYKVREIKKVVEKSGFKVEDARALTWWCLPFNHYIVNLVARGIAHSAFTATIRESLSKYTTNPKRPILLDIAFRCVNLLDRLNDIWQPRSSGVAVFVKAVKM